MNEEQWLACANPHAMLQEIKPRASARRLRLFAVACCRAIWPLLKDARSRYAVEVAERFAEGRETEQELSRVRNPLTDVIGEWAPMYATRPVADGAAEGMFATLAEVPDETAGRLLLEVFGNPYRPARRDPAWLAWDGGVALRLAQAIYDERAFDRLPILADALEEAGCRDPALLGHCRRAGGHVLGCWALDLVLGKE